MKSRACPGVLPRLWSGSCVIPALDERLEMNSLLGCSSTAVPVVFSWLGSQEKGSPFLCRCFQQDQDVSSWDKVSVPASCCSSFPNLFGRSELPVSPGCDCVHPPCPASDDGRDELCPAIPQGMKVISRIWRHMLGLDLFGLQQVLDSGRAFLSNSSTLGYSKSGK